MFIVNSAAASTNWDVAVNEVQDILKKRGIEILQCEKWEERKFAYILNGHKRGVYLLMYFNAPPESIALIKQDLKLSDSVLRSLIVKVDRIKEPPRQETETQDENPVPVDSVAQE